VRDRLATYVLIVALGLLTVITAPASRTVFAPDEADYAAVAREMLAGGDLAVPRLDGRVWLEKPPLVFWLLAAAFAALGCGFPAAVVLNTLLTALTAAVIAWHARRTSARAGLFAALVFLTMLLPSAVARSALTDAALVLCTTAAIVVFLRGGWTHALWAGLCLGFGTLAKGPVAPLVVLAALLAAALAARSRRETGRAVLTAGVGALVTLPWLAVLAARGLLPQLGAQFVGGQVVARVVERWNVAAPFWYYLPVLWAMAFPWGTHLALGVLGWRSWAQRPWRRDPVLAAEAAAVVAPLLAFSAATNKLPHYLLPVLPFLALWLGRAFASRSEVSARSRRAVAFVAAIAGPAILLAGVRMLPHAPMAHVLPEWVPAFAVGLAVALAALAALEIAGRPTLAWCGLAAVGIVLWLVLDLGVLPQLERQRVNRPVAEAVRAHLPPGGIAVAHRRWTAPFRNAAAIVWRQSGSADELDELVRRARHDGTAVLVVTGAESEGDARTVAWQNGGEAREAFRFIGVGETVFELVEIVGLKIAPERDGARWFCDFDSTCAGLTGFSAPEGDRWVANFRWTVALTATVPVPALTARPTVVRLRAWGLADCARPQMLRASLGACELGTVRLNEVAREFSFLVAPACAAEPTRIGLNVGRLVRPCDVQPASSDCRTLGVALDWLAVEATEPARYLTATGK